MWETLSDDGSIHDVRYSYTYTDAFASKPATLDATIFASSKDGRVRIIAELETLTNFRRTVERAGTLRRSGACWHR